MNPYAKVLGKIFTLSKMQGVNRSLSNIEHLCKVYNFPEKSYPTVHVAGTNGKGSVCTKIAGCLKAEGYRTGLYTSPHISSFRERIRINGEMISEQELTSLLEELQETIDRLNIPATFFEIATLLAFLHFQRKKVDIAVIETGLGGMWDATNVVKPLVSVITSIGYDHMDILGTSLEEIATAKAGILKKGIPLVIGPDVDFSFMEEKAKPLECPIYQCSHKNEDYDLENQAIANLALSTFASHFPISPEALQIGLSSKPPCRFEKHALSSPVVLDVAHNGHGFRRLLQKLKQSYPSFKFRFVLGFSKGKDISECAQLISEHAQAIHLVSGSHPRLASTEDIHKFFPIGLLENSIAEGVAHALQLGEKDGAVIVIAGSFFIMQEARKALGLQDPEDPEIWYDPMRTISKTESGKYLQPDQDLKHSNRDL